MLDLNKNKELQKIVEQYVNNHFNKDVVPTHVLRDLFVTLHRNSLLLDISENEISSILINGICSKIIIDWMLVPHEICALITKLPVFVPLNNGEKSEISLIGKIKTKTHDVYIYTDDYFPLKEWLFGSDFINNPISVFRVNLR